MNASCKEHLSGQLRCQLALELRARRNKLGITQTELTTLTGIATSEISSLEHGRSNPTLATLAVLTSALGVELRLVNGAKALRSERLEGLREAYKEPAELIRRYEENKRLLRMANPGPGPGSPGSPYSFDDRMLVYLTLLRNKGNVKRTARELHVPENTVRRWRNEWSLPPYSGTGRENEVVTA